MKKTYLLLVFNLVFFSVIYAQVKWGVGAGLHNTTVIEKNSLQGWDQQYKGNFTPLGGFHAGIFSEISISKNANWAVQPALLYTNKGRKFSKSYDSTKSFINDTSTINASWKINYLELPVNLLYRIPLSTKVR
ncbi:MAG TPA: outer membrane beta-barrel protein, partial [Agriterribacter sp.]|nr:outer membrane beta-barrel protein [Agriterribacter sp.]